MTPGLMVQSPDEVNEGLVNMNMRIGPSVMGKVLGE
jgi:hypothetical protein